MGTEDTSTVANEDNVISDLDSKIIRQVEYYFGDYNLARDNFLKIQTQSNDGWVTLETMIKFNRLKLLTEDCTAIASALRKSTNEVLEVNEEGTQIRRNPQKPLPNNTEEARVERDGRTIYTKGFKVDATLDELIEYFKQFGHAENIQMRRLKTGKKKFKGSVFVTFKTEEEAKKFLGEKVIEYRGTVLLREMKPDYLTRKNIEFEERVKSIKEKKRKRMEEGENKETDEKQTSEKETGEKPKNAASDEVPLDITKGCLMKLTGLSKETMRENLKDILEPHGTVSYVDYSKGEPRAVVRFESSVAAEVLEKVSTEKDGARKIEICGADATAFVIEGDDEMEYMKNIKQWRNQRYNRPNKRGGYQNRGRGGRFSNRGGRGGGRGNRQKRKFEDDNGEEASEHKAKKGTSEREPPSKAAETGASEQEPPAKKSKDETAEPKEKITRPTESSDQEPPKKVAKTEEEK